MIPAIVIGADINGLGVVRSLARKGVPTWLVDRDLADPSLRTRYATKVALPALGGSPLIDGLIGLRTGFATDPVLFLTREESVEAVSEHLDQIALHYRFAMPPAALIRRLSNKDCFQTLAQKHGFPIPRAVCLGGVEDLAAADAPSYPCVLKPASKTPLYAARFKKAYKVESRPELMSLLREIDGAAPMIAQEWIEGGDDRIYFCLQYRSRAPGSTVSFTGRKLRSWPPATGGTASCAPAPDAAAELERLTDAFFTTVGYFGIGSMEFKQDARTGRFLMIEPTVGRTDFQEEIATLNGVNIPFAAYCAETGRDLGEACSDVPAAAWAVAPIDRWSAGRQQVARSFPRGLRRHDALWRFDDPMPWCSAAMGRLKTRLRVRGRLRA